jgi:hypothetical protein
VLALLCCFAAVSTRADDAVEGKFWVSPDRSEVLVSFPEKSEAFYFNNDKTRLCYSFKVLGKWQPSEESALLLSLDGRSQAGVKLYSAAELKDFDGADLVTRATRLITQDYEKALGRKLTNVKITPFETEKHKGIKWTASWPGPRRGVEMKASKVFVELASGWVAQITANGTGDDDALTRLILESLNTTSHPEGYWPIIKKNFPFVR